MSPTEETDAVKRLHKWSQDHPEEYCPHVASGVIQFDPGQGTKHFDPWWMLVICDTEIIRYYSWFLKRYGKPVWLSRLWGAHVSVIKHEEPPKKELWGKPIPEVVFRHSNIVRSDNDKHAWVDVYSPQLSEIRQSMGLPAKEWFHLTIGRLM